MKLSKNTLLKLKQRNKSLKLNKYKKKRRNILRGKLKGTFERPRLSVYRSNQHIYAQIINDINSETIVSCSTLDRSIVLTESNNTNCDKAWLIGEEIAKLSLKKNIQKILFDRGPYLYHGRIKALAEGARSGGLSF